MAYKSARRRFLSASTQRQSRKMTTRLAQQIAFILEIDRLKSVLRQSRLIDSRRRENSAEHSWHIAVMALILAEHANAPFDLLHVLKMLLVHDIVEIDAGDTPAYADQGAKVVNEEHAAQRIFGLLPDDQRDECIALWHEFDAGASAESKFANAVDRLMPTLHNFNTDGGSWVTFGVDMERVTKRLQPIDDGSHVLWEYVQTLLEQAAAQGLIR